MPNAVYIPVPSIWGHFAGGLGTDPEDVRFINGKLKELLASWSVIASGGIADEA